MEISKRYINVKISDQIVKNVEVELIEKFNSESLDSVKINIKISQNQYSGVGTDWFSALQDLRGILEKSSIQLLCNGSAINVYPSPMQQSFGGEKAHKIVLKERAKIENVVDIFEYDANLKICTVNEQKVFYNNWIDSLR